MKREGRIKQLFQHAGLAILEVGLGGRVHYLNKRAEVLLGITSREAYGLYVWEFLKEKKAGFDKLVEMLRQHPQGISDVPVRIVGQKILSLWAEACVTPFSFDARDEGYLIFLKDVTKRKVSEDRVRETTNILVNVLNDSVDAIMGITLDNKIFLWNRGAEDVFGYTSEEMIGHPLDLLIPEDIRERDELSFFTREALEKGFVRDYITDRIRKDGRRITVDITRTVVHDATGKEIGFSAIVRDITEQVKLQQQVIQNERLSVMGRMAAQVAHEIRNPLSSIILNIELIDEDLAKVDGPVVREISRMLKTVDREVEHLSNLTDDYLSFVRMPVLHKEEVKSYDLINEVCTLMHREIVDKGLHLDTRNRQVPYVEMDRNQVRRALINILKNAIEASDTGSVIRVWCSVSGDRKWLCINFRDFGPGIRPEDMDRVFDLFYTTKLTGSGLGMHITRMIMREHGGDVELFSRPGKGTLARLTLPLGSESC